MRGFLTLLLIGALGYGAYWYWNLEELPADPTGVSEESDQNSSDLTPQDSSPATAEAQELPKPPPPPSEEETLRQTVAESTGADADEARFQLARLLLAKKTPAANAEARRLFRQVFDGGGEHAPHAAAFMLRRSEAGSEQIELASYLHARGPTAPAYAQSCLALGTAKIERKEDSAKIEGWQLLSDAYFAYDDEEWRKPVRERLLEITEHLFFSPRLNEACHTYTVKSGDSLWHISRTQKTTVEALQTLNPQKGKFLQPGQRLKIIRGQYEIHVKKTEFRLDVLLDGRFLYSAPVGLGRHGNTPMGTFEIDVRQFHPDWQRPGFPTVKYGEEGNLLGEAWLGFKNTADHQGFGIHGTWDEASIGQESSEGCVRMLNSDVVKLYKFIPVGTKVIIRE